jgi:hypothetical protein
MVVNGESHVGVNTGVDEAHTVLFALLKVPLRTAGTTDTSRIFIIAGEYIFAIDERTIQRGRQLRRWGLEDPIVPPQGKERLMRPVL